MSDGLHWPASETAKRGAYLHSYVEFGRLGRRLEFWQLRDNRPRWRTLLSPAWWSRFRVRVTPSGHGERT
jgi:hypothetical protein